MADYTSTHTGPEIDASVTFTKGLTSTNTQIDTSVGVTEALTAGTLYASQAEAEAGSVNDKLMTPLRTKQAVDKNLAARIGTSGPAGCRNKIHNPRFMVNQRGVSGTVTLAAGAFGHDRWKAGASGCTYTLSTTQGRTTLTISAGSLVQTVDGLDIAAGSNTHTLSWGGTCKGKIGSGSYGTSGITGLATGNTNINIEFGTGTLYEPQFEIGTVASEFDCLPYALEHDRCQWYLPGLWGPSGQGFIPANVHCISATRAKCTLEFPRSCRVSPTGLVQFGTFAIRDSADADKAATLVFDGANPFGCGLRADLDGGLTTGHSGQLNSTSAFRLLFTGGEI